MAARKFALASRISPPGVNSMTACIRHTAASLLSYSAASSFSFVMSTMTSTTRVRLAGPAQ